MRLGLGEEPARGSGITVPRSHEELVEVGVDGPLFGPDAVLRVHDAAPSTPRTAAENPFHSSTLRASSACPAPVSA